MGQKVNPHGMRVGIIQDWNAKWIADKKDFAKYIKEDDVIRTTLKKKYFQAGISKIIVERSEGKVIVDIRDVPVFLSARRARAQKRSRRSCKRSSRTRLLPSTS